MSEWAQRVLPDVPEVMFDDRPDFDPGYLPVAFGRDEHGFWCGADLVDTPHLLIAGTTGSGKSVMIHCIVCSMLEWATPADVGFVMIDMKRVELAPYKQVPHLLLPVITEPEDAKLALHWLVAEMERRFSLLEANSIRDIAALRDGWDIEFPERIVVVVDELADLILQMPEVETPLVRLAQKARAAGIHLILATQRPTTDVVTGLIKANVPSRMAFQVASSIDSRIILDVNGAEDLLGRGDVLYRQAGLPMVHFQGAYISPKRVDEIVQGVV